MAMPSSSDADVTSEASADDSEGAIAGFCCMHVIETLSRVISLGEKSFKKFKECTNLWKKAENTPESKIAYNADRYDWDCVETPTAASVYVSEEQGIDDRDREQLASVLIVKIQLMEDPWMKTDTEDEDV